MRETVSAWKIRRVDALLDSGMAWRQIGSLIRYRLKHLSFTAVLKICPKELRGRIALASFVLLES